MQHLRSLSGLHLQKAWATIGSFDGVHRGHQAIIQGLVQSAHAAGAPAVVITFHPHPAVLLRGIHTPFTLTSPQERAELLGNLGVDYVITLPFDHQMAQLSAQDFMSLLVASLGLACLCVGHDFALGRGRAGDIPALRELGQRLGYTLQAMPPVANSGEVISSSLVRAALQSGAVETAAALLGRPYSVQGRVVHGQERGRTLGIPTANLELPPERLLPANGVYATWAEVSQARHAAVTNIGVRPTFEQQPVLARVEAHLLDFEADIYGQELRLQFIARLRGERPFAGVPALLEQIQRDIAQTREVLRHA